MGAILAYFATRRDILWKLRGQNSKKRKDEKKKRKKRGQIRSSSV
jgi:hypothetical protein